MLLLLLLLTHLKIFCRRWLCLFQSHKKEPKSDTQKDGREEDQEERGKERKGARSGPEEEEKTPRTALGNPGVTRTGNDLLTLPFATYKSISRQTLRPLLETEAASIRACPSKTHGVPDTGAEGTRGGPWWVGKQNQRSGMSRPETKVIREINTRLRCLPRPEFLLLHHSRHPGTVKPETDPPTPARWPGKHPPPPPTAISQDTQMAGKLGHCPV